MKNQHPIDLISSRWQNPANDKFRSPQIETTDIRIQSNNSPLCPKIELKQAQQHKKVNIFIWNFLENDTWDFVTVVTDFILESGGVLVEPSIFFLRAKESTFGLEEPPCAIGLSFTVVLLVSAAIDTHTHAHTPFANYQLHPID